jgi:hypothetical protein
MPPSWRTGVKSCCAQAREFDSVCSNVGALAYVCVGRRETA